MIDCDRYVRNKSFLDLKVFSRNHAGNVKYYFQSNVPHGWRFQLFKEIDNAFLESSYKALN